MLDWLFRGRKRRLFLGSVTVVPSEEGLDNELQARLESVFGLPNASEVANPEPSDFVLDVYVPEYRVGDAMLADANVGDLGGGLPLMFRPRVEVRARLYSLRTGKTKKVFSIKKKMPLGEGMSRFFRLRSLLGIPGQFNKGDVEVLLYDACNELLEELKAYR